MNFHRQAWRLDFETTRNLVIGNITHGGALYAVVFRANLSGAVERVTAEAQALVDEATQAGSIGWPVKPQTRKAQIDPRFARCRANLKEMSS